MLIMNILGLVKSYEIVSFACSTIPPYLLTRSLRASKYPCSLKLPYLESILKRNIPPRYVLLLIYFPLLEIFFSVYTNIFSYLREIYNTVSHFFTHQPFECVTYFSS